MSTEDVTCRIRVELTDTKGEHRLFNICEVSGIPEEVKKQWVQKITDYIWGPGSNQGGSRLVIRPWDFILRSDGSFDSLPVPNLEQNTSSGVYPAHYRIPPTIYEIACGKKPLEGLSDEEVQQHYSNAEFLDDVPTLPPDLLITILSCWSVEFANIINPPRSKFAGFAAAAGSYIKAHPYLFALQITGALSLTAAAIAPAILGAVGFGALGPVAGSTAAGWQASIGVVEAGSLFAWCQSAAMGEAAVNAIVATGAAGGGVAALATGVAAAQNQGLDVDILIAKFKEVYRQGDFGD
ncbi:hypothetical protein EPUS_04445 [Endocarpon pusillum Z07020]|uniref:Uncharacterized protein n=1 Tax=Endocarpon pusillum (strain Z07020 / HMAS-L-300199) TaxID=1263415 RepID=U1I0B8_ENDPU|nr:uncharacterized protein EPUS_04445 [Endocarpon pusillum Z07020]ERF76625.1 hypothetical protein EPUS_04445 [Endocarpon pusillum Z07020]